MEMSEWCVGDLCPICREDELRGDYVEQPFCGVCGFNEDTENSSPKSGREENQASTERDGGIDTGTSIPVFSSAAG